VAFIDPISNYINQLTKENHVITADTHRYLLNYEHISTWKWQI